MVCVVLLFAGLWRFVSFQTTDRFTLPWQFAKRADWTGRSEHLVVRLGVEELSYRLRSGLLATIFYTVRA